MKTFGFALTAELPALLVVRRRLFGVIATAALVLVPTFASAQDDDEEEALEEFIEMVLGGDYDEAEEILDELPESKTRRLWEARLLRETGRADEGITRLVGSDEYEASDPLILTRTAGLRVERGQWEEAEAELKQALEKFDATNEHRVEALTRLGLLQLSAGQRRKGKRTLEEVLGFYRALSSARARELDANTYVWIGRACEGLNRYRDAYEVMYSSAFNVAGDHAAAHVASGHTLLAKYNYPDARSHFKDAIRENPSLAEAHLGLAYSTYVDFQYPRNRFFDTQKALRAAERIWPDHPDALILRGHLAFFDENWPEAEDYYRRAVAVCPPDLTYQAFVGVLLYATHRLEELAELEAKIQRMHPKPAEFYATMAEKLTDRFFYTEAADFARKAVDIDPEYWPAYVTLGVNALRSGRDEEGREFIEKAFQNDKFNVWAFNTRVLIRHIDKNFMEKKTEDFTFRLHKDDEPFLLPYLEPLMMAAKKRMEEQYQVTITKPITFEDFSQHKYFSARSIGLPGLAASGVCFGRMVTLTTPKAIPGNWGAVAIHEFGHVIALHKAKQRVPRWFTEGLSVFEEGRDNPAWTRYFADEFVEAVYHDGLLPMAKLQSGFTKPDSPGRILLSYYQGGVICGYIEQTFGFDKIVAMLAAYGEGKLTEDIFPAILGVTLDEFDEGFFAYTRTLAESMGLQPRIPLANVEDIKYREEDNPEDLATKVELGFAYFFNGRETDAELVAGRAAKLDQPSGDLEALFGLLKLTQNKLVPARRHLEKAIELGTKYRYRVRLGLAMLLRSQDERPRAIELMKEAIAIHPTGTRPRFGTRENPYYILINMLREEGEDEESRRYLQQVAKIDRDDVTARLRLLMYYTGEQEWAKALEYAEDIVYIDPYRDLHHHHLAQAYYGLERYAECRRELEMLLKTEEPDMERIAADLAWCYHKTGAPEEAKEWANRALEFDPEESRARMILEGE